MDIQTPEKRLIYIRKVLNMFHQELAEKLGLSVNQIKNRENQRTKIDPMFANHLANILNINPKWLLTGKGGMFLRELDIPNDFIIRVKTDIEKTDKESLEKIRFKEKIKYFVQKKVNLTRKEVIQLAQILRQPIDEYLDISGNIPNSLLEISGGNRKLNILFRKMGELNPDEINKLLNTIEVVVDGFVAKYKKGD